VKASVTGSYGPWAKAAQWLGIGVLKAAMSIRVEQLSETEYLCLLLFIFLLKDLPPYYCYCTTYLVP
jgi:hypothetical protein